MVVAGYLSAVAFGCCVVWLILASTGLDRMKSRGWDDRELSWRRVWPPVLASAAMGAAVLVIRFVEAEAPVSLYVVARGWVGLFCAFAAVAAGSAALIMGAVGWAARCSRRQTSSG